MVYNVVVVVVVVPSYGKIAKQPTTTTATDGVDNSTRRGSLALIRSVISLSLFSRHLLCACVCTCGANKHTNMMGACVVAQ